MTNDTTRPPTCSSAPRPGSRHEHGRTQSWSASRPRPGHLFAEGGERRAESGEPRAESKKTDLGPRPSALCPPLSPLPLRKEIRWPKQKRRLLPLM